MKTKLFTIAMMVAFIMTAMTKVQAQNFEGPCLPSSHGLSGHQSAFCGSTETQTIALLAGTNWFSTYLDITQDDLQDALVDALPGATNIVIKSKGGNSRWNGSRWRGTNFVWDVASMYRIEVSEACEFTLMGMPINPAEHSITIAPNTSTWIGFPFNESKTLDQAFPNGFAVTGDVIKSKDGSARYNGTRWRGTGGFNSLEPGNGYIYNSNASSERTLIFPTGAK